MSDFNLLFCGYRESVKFTYEHDGGSVRSWPDHILTLQHDADIICGVHSVHSPSNFSDHVPLAFVLKLDASANDVPRRVTSIIVLFNSPFRGIDWSILNANHIEDYRQMIFHSLPSLSQDLLSCRSACCLLHRVEIDLFCNQLLSCLSVASNLCLSKRARAMPGWNDHVRKVSTMLWNRIWVKAGCPEAGVLFDLRKQTKKAYKYAVRRVKRRQKHIVSEKLSKHFCWPITLHSEEN